MAAHLLSPIRLGPYTLVNRIVMAPMTRNRSGPAGVPQEMNALYYAQRASAGLIVTEATQVSAQGVSLPNTPGIHTAAQVQGWKRVTQAVHDAGGRIFLQLWHGGRISHPSLQPGGALPVAPSPIRPAGKTMTPEGWRAFVTPRELARDEISGIVGQFRKAAANALEAGFDGVEIHAANGYLIDQFLRDGTNRRMDDYGGCLECRARLLIEVTGAVAEVWDGERVGVRLSPVGTFNDMSDAHPQMTFEYALIALNALRPAYVHIVETNESRRNLDFHRLREATDAPYMANGGYDKERGDEALARGAADLVSFGAAFIANPDLPRRFATNEQLNTGDRSAFYGGGAEGYVDYPALEASRAPAHTASRE